MTGNVPAALVLDLMRPGDRTAVLQVFDGMSPRSRRQRYLAAVPRLTERMLTLLSDEGGRRQVAVGAWLGGRCVGIARAVRPLADAPGGAVAELAVEVVDEHQGGGLGTRLLERLAAEAGRAGIRELQGVVDPHNRAALRLMRSVGARLRIADGLVWFDWTLARPAAAAR